MKLDEDIINLITLRKVLSEGTDPIFLKSLDIGIEALKRVQLARKDFGYIDPSLLLGETED